MMGPGGSGAAGPWGQMMLSGMWSWMRDGTWQQMGPADWQRLSDQWIGPGMMSARGEGWSATDTALVVGATLIAAGLVIGGLLVWRARREARPF